MQAWLDWQAWWRRGIRATRHGEAIGGSGCSSAWTTDAIEDN